MYNYINTDYKHNMSAPNNNTLGQLFIQKVHRGGFMVKPCKQNSAIEVIPSSIIVPDAASPFCTSHSVKQMSQRQ